MLSLSLSLSGRLSFSEVFCLQRYKSHIWAVADPFLYLYLAESQIDERCGDLAKL